MDAKQRDRQRAKLATQILRAQAKLAHKARVCLAHPVGSAWHTRAAKEITSIDARIAGLTARLRALD